MKLPGWTLALGLLVVARPAGAITLDEVRSNVAAYRGQTLELTGRISGTIHSDRGRTFLVDLGRSGYVFIRAVPDSAPVRHDQRVTITARVPAEATMASELEFVAATPARTEPQPAMTTEVSVVSGSDRVTVSSTMVPGASPPKDSARPAAPTSSAIPQSALDREVARLKPHYAKAIAHFNKRLSPAQREQIADAVLRFSISNGLDPRLTVAVIAVESSFNPVAVSRSGAMGLGQLMPGTAAGMGVSNAFDPIANVNAAVRLIRGHLEKYGHRKDAFNLAMAAYNAGSGAVRKFGGVPPYKETVNHIWKVYHLYRQLAPEVFQK